MDARMLLSLAAAIAAACVAGPAKGAVLVEDGKARAEIVLPEKAWPAEQAAAKELRLLLKKASGAELAIVERGKEKPGFAQVLIGRAAGLDGLAPFTGKVAAGGGVLRIAGGDGPGNLKSAYVPCGTLYAVYEFADRELGARFLWPDDRFGVVVAKRPTVEVRDGTAYGYVPPFENVRIRHFPVAWGRRAARICEVKVNYPDGRSGGHAFVNWWKDYAKSHPDFFEMVNGRRNAKPGASMCVANPAFHAEIVRLWKEARTKEPGKVFAINACENDTKGKCECPLCTAWNNPEADPKDASERYAHFYKALYELAAKEDPSVRVYGYAYSNYVNPPRLLKLPENVFISYVPSPKQPYNAEWREKVIGNIHRWQKVGCTLNYRPNLLDGYAMPEDISTDYYTEFQEMLKAHMKSIDIDGPNKSFATQGPFLYVLGRMMVHPDWTLERLKDEYYSAFGPAKGAVRDYWEYWNRYALDNAEKFHQVPKEHNPLRHGIFFGFHYAFYAHLLFPPETLARGAELLGRAEAAAQGSPDDLARVLFLKAGLDHATLCAKACAVFRDKKTTTEQRAKALGEVKEFRERRLPEWAADVSRFCKIAGQNEQVAWTFNSFYPEMLIELPLKWRLKLDPEDRGASLGYGDYGFDDSSWQWIDTDRHLEKQGIESGYRNAWYRTKVEVPAKFKGARCVAHFGGIDEGCVLYVNGRKAGEFKFDHANDPDTWRRPMEFDVTAFMPEDGRMSIALKVVNDIGGGGLWQPSELRFFRKENSVLERPDAVTYKGRGKMYFDTVKLYALKHPGDKMVAVSLEYRIVGNGKVVPYLKEMEIGKKPIRDQKLQVLSDSAGEWRKAEFSARTLPETQRIDLQIRAAIPEGANAEVRNLKVELR